MNGKDKNLAYFYNLYSAFLELDCVDSLTYGRNRELIKSFYNVYLKISNNENLEKAKEILKNDFDRYASIKRIFEVTLKQPTNKDSKYLHIITNPNITQAFRELSKAIETYSKWRECLSNEHIKIIYIANLKDRQKYYFNGNLDDLNDCIAKYLDSKNARNNKILKQTLIEFHNAISHLTEVYAGRQFDAEQDSNKTRAINHFKRGALDSYKAIIKDYFCLKDTIKINDSIINDIKDTRQYEYNTIGDDKNRKDIFKKYNQIANTIILSFQKLR